MSTYQSTLAVTAAFAFVSFALSIWFVFDRSARVTRGLMVLKVGAVISGSAEVYAICTSDAVTPVAFAIAMLLYLVSIALYVWAIQTTRRSPFTVAFSTDAPARLVATGPYRLVRHPFYTAYLIAYVAGFVGSLVWWLWFFIAGMIAIYVEAARSEEAKFARSALAAEYDGYRRRVGMFIPRLALSRR